MLPQLAVIVLTWCSVVRGQSPSDPFVALAHKWKAPVSGTWSDGAKWASGYAPCPDDNVLLPLASNESSDGYNVTLNQDEMIGNYLFLYRGSYLFLEANAKLHMQANPEEAVDCARTTAKNTSLPPRKGFFTCDSGDQYVSESFLCALGQPPKCDDASDQDATRCKGAVNKDESEPCPADHPFRCSRLCLSASKVCDGRRDCLFGADESPGECGLAPGVTIDGLIPDEQSRDPAGSSGSSVALIAGAAVGAAVLITLVVVVVVMKRKIQRLSATKTPTPTIPMQQLGDQSIPPPSIAWNTLTYGVARDSRVDPRLLSIPPPTWPCS